MIFFVQKIFSRANAYTPDIFCYAEQGGFSVNARTKYLLHVKQLIRKILYVHSCSCIWLHEREYI